MSAVEPLKRKIAMRCENYDWLDLPKLLNRRELLSRASTGLTGMALASLLMEDAARAEETSGPVRLQSRPSKHIRPAVLRRPAVCFRW